MQFQLYLNNQFSCANVIIAMSKAFLLKTRKCIFLLRLQNFFVSTCFKRNISLTTRSSLTRLRRIIYCRRWRVRTGAKEIKERNANVVHWVVDIYALLKFIKGADERPNVVSEVYGKLGEHKWRISLASQWLLPYLSRCKIVFKVNMRTCCTHVEGAVAYCNVM